jgi:hypothetical protein
MRGHAQYTSRLAAAVAIARRGSGEIFTATGNHEVAGGRARKARTGRKDDQKGPTCPGIHARG